LRAGNAVNDLIAALGDSSYMVRKNAARSLGQIGGDAAKKALEKATSDPDKIVAHTATEALEKLRT
jgi:HEAT repeat protein